MYTQASGSALVYYLPTVLLCLRVTGRLVHTVHTTRGICTLYAVSCTWYGYTYDDDDEDDDMTRCRIHRDAALREARERGGWEGGKIVMAGTRVVRS